MVKVTKNWTGKKDAIPDPRKKEQHKDRKTKKELEHHWEDDDWLQQLKEFYASTEI